MNTLYLYAFLSRFFGEKVQSLSWHPLDPQTLATGCCDKIVRVADCRTKEIAIKISSTMEHSKIPPKVRIKVRTKRREKRNY